MNFLFLSLGLKVQGSVSGNIRKGFFWENVRNYLIIELERSFYWNIRNFFWVDFVYYFKLKPKNMLGSCILYYCLLPTDFINYLFFSVILLHSHFLRTWSTCFFWLTAKFKKVLSFKFTMVNLFCLLRYYPFSLCNLACQQLPQSYPYQISEWPSLF